MATRSFTTTVTTRGVRTAVTTPTLEPVNTPGVTTHVHVNAARTTSLHASGFVTTEIKVGETNVRAEEYPLTIGPKGDKGDPGEAGPPGETPDLTSVEGAIVTLQSQTTALASRAGALELEDVSLDSRLDSLESTTASLAPKVLPPGGGSGQVLAKTSTGDYDVGWAAAASGVLPSGGASGTLLGKLSSANYDADWITAIKGGNF